ncbi:hypothetical protein CRUP_017528 [Coryphaenoides rupestris]|nr:hypothetical protein CRUP_017528 [Coryphaenoides rupestris]
MLAWTLLLAQVLGLAGGSLVTVNRGLRVKKGQAAFLQEGDLQFDIPRHGDSCKVEVVANEPITQRVGKLTPECSVIKLGPKSLEVPEFYGLSDVLDGNVVSFRYERRSSLECSVQLGSQATPLPVHGQLVIGDPEEPTKRGDEPESFVPLRRQALCKREDCLKGLKLVKFTQVSCDDFLMMGVRYQHRTPPSPDMDYIYLRVDLRDTRSGSIYQSEQAWLPVRIAGAVPNQPPRPSFMATFILEVDQFILTPLSTATLCAEDDETPEQWLVFNVTQPPAEGFLTHLADHTRPISSFTWLDLNDMLIAYQPPNSSHAQRRNYEVSGDRGGPN